jgi:hypothetical protein
MSQKVSKKNSELIALVRFLNTTPVEKGSKAEAKLKKIATKIKPLFDAYNEEREDIRLDHAHTLPSGVLDLDDKGEFKFTKDGIKAMTADLKNLHHKEFEFYQFTFSTEGIEDFTALHGWVEGIESGNTEEDEQV